MKVTLSGHSDCGVFMRLFLWKRLSFQSVWLHWLELADDLEHDFWAKFVGRLIGSGWPSLGVMSSFILVPPHSQEMCQQCSASWEKLQWDFLSFWLSVQKQFFAHWMQLAEDCNCCMYCSYASVDKSVQQGIAFLVFLLQGLAVLSRLSCGLVAPLANIKLNEVSSSSAPLQIRCVLPPLREWD